MRLRACAYTNASFTSLWGAILPIVAVTTFLLHTALFGERLHPAAGFTALTLFNILKFPLKNLPSIISSFTRAFTSFTRIRLFLDAPEVDGIFIEDEQTEAASKPLSVSVLFRNVSFGWISSAPPKEPERRFCCVPPQSYSLLEFHDSRDETDIETAFDSYTAVRSDTSISVPRKALALVVGVTGTAKYQPLYILLVYLQYVGSGKSTFLQCILGECIRRHGVVRIQCSSISYAPQSSFLQSGSIRDNILFGSMFDEDRYRTVLWCCALVRDIEMLKDGDLYDVGEKGAAQFLAHSVSSSHYRATLGSNLSGGQQQRVALARAAYAYSDLVLLDDPLSAVDPKIAEHIFHHLICGFLRDRTRILVAHQVSLALHASNTVIYFDSNNSVVQLEPTKFADILRTRYVNDSSDFHEKSPKYMYSNKNGIDEPLMLYSGPLGIDLGASLNDEVKSVGEVSFAVYVHYLKACGGLVVIGSLASLLVGVHVIDVVENLVLKSWMEMIQFDQANQAFTLTGYIILMMLTVLMKVGSSFYSASISLTAAQRLHDIMVL